MVLISGHNTWSGNTGHCHECNERVSSGIDYLTLGLNGHVGVFKTDGQPIEKYNEVSFQLSEIPSIVAATPQIQGQVMATLRALHRGCAGGSLADPAACKPLKKFITTSDFWLRMEVES